MLEYPGSCFLNKKIVETLQLVFSDSLMNLAIQYEFTRGHKFKLFEILGDTIGNPLIFTLYLPAL